MRATDTTHCLNCNKPFSYYHPKSALERKYCSVSCSSKINSAKNLKNGERPSWNKGLTKKDPRVKKYSLAVKKRMTENNPWKGKKRPEHSKRMSGEKHWNWQGGINPENDSLRKSYLFKDWAKEVKNIWNYECQICGTNHGPLHSNHIKKFSDHENLRYEVKNGIVLCKKCHEKLVNHHEKEWESYFNFCWDNKLFSRKAMNYVS